MPRESSIAVAKTWSWAAVSFFVILAIDLAAHAAIHGSDGIGKFAATAAVGTLLACIGKSPVYLLHERAWDRRTRALAGRSSVEVCLADQFAE